MGIEGKTYSDNPYHEDSDEFDLFERKITQKIKKMDNVKCPSYPIGEEPEFIEYGSLKGSKVLKEKQPSLVNNYASAKGK